MLFSPVFIPDAMHIPDGFLSFLVSMVYWVASILVLSIAIKRTNQDVDERKLPLMGVMAAAIFAGQMLNFTVLGGTSGHLLGAAIATVLLGVWPAVLVMTSVVAVQAIIFQDGGLLALGANIFNMAIVGVFVAFTIFSLTKKVFSQHSKVLVIAGFFAAWGSIFAAALSCALQLALSGTSPANIAIPAMAGIHALIGIGEGLITMSALAFIQTTRKDLLKVGDEMHGGNRGILVGGLSIAVFLAILSPLASIYPDGLEWVAEQNGFLSLAKESFYKIIPNYSLPGVSDSALATILAGIIGICIILAITFGISRARRQTPVHELTER